MASQDTSHSSVHHGNASLHGAALMQQLRGGWKPLPNRTLVAMALGGLRVRMMRSTVTMLSVVLAIAFLAYTGLTSQLTYSLAIALQDYQHTPDADLRKVQQASERLAKIDPFIPLPPEQWRDLAVKLNMDQVTTLESQRLTVSENVRLARNGLDLAKVSQQKIEKDKNTLPVDRDGARAKTAAAQSVLETLEAKLAKVEAQLSMAQFIRSGKTTDNEDSNQRLKAQLLERYRALVTAARSPARLGGDVEQAEMLIRLSGTTEEVRILIDAIGLEKRKRDGVNLQQMLRRAGVNVKETLAGNPMDLWLILMAMLTCAIGIANAMLMSVTERFREIGTMKCLGAQDNLVIKLFLLESACLGVVGAVIGMMLGVVVAVIGAVLQYKGYGLEHFPLLAGWKVLVWSVVGGIVLTLIGAAGPAWSAARMRPVDALRVDE